MESVLYQAATRREDLLRNFYRIGRRAVSRTSPWAFAIPTGQRDPVAAAKLIETLAFGQVEIEQAAQAFEAGGKKYSAGTWVIRMQQPYSSFAKTLLERQSYPDLRLYPGGPPKRPYDVTAHTLPLLMGVQVDAIDSPVAVPLAPLSGEIPSKPRPLAIPARIGVYKSFVPAIDEGWTRWVLEQFGVPYHSAANSDILAGDLRRRFDALIFPDQRPASIVRGYRAGEMPEECTGGLGEKGAEALKRFVSDGGTLVFLNHSTQYATETFGLDVKNVVRGLSNTEFYSPGSLLNVTLDSNSPLTRGLPAEIAIWSEGSPAWDVPQGSPARVAARYPQSGILASGWLLGEKYLAGKAGADRLPHGLGPRHPVRHAPAIPRPELPDLPAPLQRPGAGAARNRGTAQAVRRRDGSGCPRLPRAAAHALMPPVPETPHAVESRWG